MKKIWTLFLAGLLTFSLAACGSTAESGEPQSSYSQTESAEESTAPASSRAASPAGESGASSAGSRRCTCQSRNPFPGWTPFDLPPTI